MWLRRFQRDRSPISVVLGGLLVLGAYLAGAAGLGEDAEPAGAQTVHSAGPSAADQHREKAPTTST